MSEQTCATCRHFESRASVYPSDWCRYCHMAIPPGCRGCPAWEANPEPKDWADAAANAWLGPMLVAAQSLDDPDVKCKAKNLADLIRRHHDAACKRPDYEKMATKALTLPVIQCSVDVVAQMLREADGGGK